MRRFKAVQKSVNMVDLVKSCIPESIRSQKSASIQPSTSLRKLSRFLMDFLNRLLMNLRNRNWGSKQFTSRLNSQSDFLNV